MVAPASMPRTSCNARPFLRTMYKVDPLPAYAMPFATRSVRVMPGSDSDAISDGGSTPRSYSETPYDVAAHKSLPSMATSRYDARNGTLATCVRLHCGKATTGRRRSETATATRPSIGGEFKTISPQRHRGHREISL